MYDGGSLCARMCLSRLTYGHIRDVYFRSIVHVHHVFFFDIENTMRPRERFVRPSVTKLVSATTSDVMHRFTQYLTQ